MSSRDERAAISCLVGASAMLDAFNWFILSVIALVMYALLESLYDNTWSSRVTIDPGRAIEIGIALSADRRRLIPPTSPCISKCKTLFDTFLLLPEDGSKEDNIHPPSGESFHDNLRNSFFHRQVSRSLPISRKAGNITICDWKNDLLVASIND